MESEKIEWLYELFDEDLDAVFYECDMHPLDALYILFNEGHIKFPEYLRDGVAEGEPGE